MTSRRDAANPSVSRGTCRALRDGPDGNDYYYVWMSAEVVPSWVIGEILTSVLEFIYQRDLFISPPFNWVILSILYIMCMHWNKISQFCDNYCKKYNQ